MMKRVRVRVFASRSRAALLPGLALLLAVPAAGAATTNTTFTVNATVLAACTMSAANMNFGNYDANAATPTDTTSSLSVLCTNGQSYVVSLDAGSTAGNTMTARYMTDGSESLAYSLYTDAGRTVIWGDGTSGTGTVSGTGSGTQQAITVYGRIPVSQLVGQGSYSDTITATVTY